jgi:hypothetical protein
MATQQYRDDLREAGQRLSEQRRRERFAELLASDDGTRYVWTTLVRCPVCHGTKHVARRTERHDGTKAQRRKCVCGHKFILLFDD